MGRRLRASHGWYGRGECLFRDMSGIIPEKLVYLLFYLKRTLCNNGRVCEERGKGESNVKGRERRRELKGRSKENAL